MAATTVDEAEIKKRKNDAFMFEGQQYYRCAPSWRRKKSARRSRIPSPPPPPPPSPSSPSEETIYLKPSPWPRRLKIAVRSKPPEPEEEEEAAEYAMPSASPATTRASRLSGISIPVSSVGDNFSPPPPSDFSPSPSSPSSGSVTSPFYDDRL